VGQRKSGHVTLLDIARACEFSVSTVSIVLSDAPLSRHVAEKTRQKIRAMANRITIEIKPAAMASKSRMISVLATPGTVARDYTRALVRDFATGCDVTLVGAPNLAGLAERRLRGEPVSDAEVAREIEPCFVARAGRRTDQVVLACTHFPLLIGHFERLAPWPVAFVEGLGMVPSLLGLGAAPAPRPRAKTVLAAARFASLRLALLIAGLRRLVPALTVAAAASSTAVVPLSVPVRVWVVVGLMLLAIVRLSKRKWARSGGAHTVAQRIASAIVSG